MNQAVSDVYDQEIGAAALEQLLFDVEHAAKLLNVVIKSQGKRYAANDVCDLTMAREALAGGAVGVQLRYLHNGTEWWDTILRQPDGSMRIVRTVPPSHEG